MTDVAPRRCKRRCKQCNQPLVEIDHWSERLTGGPTCNRWQASTGEWCRLAPDDIVALRALKATSTAQRDAMGRRGRAYAESRHSYEVLAAQFLASVEASPSATSAQEAAR